MCVMMEVVRIRCGVVRAHCLGGLVGTACECYRSLPVVLSTRRLECVHIRCSRWKISIKTIVCISVMDRAVSRTLSVSFLICSLTGSTRLQIELSPLSCSHEDLGGRGLRRLAHGSLSAGGARGRRIAVARSVPCCVGVAVYPN